MTIPLTRPEFVELIKREVSSLSLLEIDDMIEDNRSKYLAIGKTLTDIEARIASVKQLYQGMGAQVAS